MIYMRVLAIYHYMQFFLDERGRVIFGYIDNNSQIMEIKIPLDVVEIENVL